MPPYDLGNRTIRSGLLIARSHRKVNGNVDEHLILVLLHNDPLGRLPT